MYSKGIEGQLKKLSIGLGDKIKLEGKGTVFEGTLMPRPDLGDNSIIILKLGNGYNIGIRCSGSVKIEKMEGKRAELIFPKAQTKSNPSLPNITMIFTGGTIGSKIDYVTGGVYMLVKPEELLYEVPELSRVANLSIIDLMSTASEDMCYKDWQLIAKEVVKAFEADAHGVLITHGTDTMHYTSAILSFMLQNLNGPVVITGAQRSSDRGSSDAFMNLICAGIVAAKSDAAEVGICMHADSSDSYCNFLRGTKVRKMHTSRRDAFKPINSEPIAKVSADGTIEYFGNYTRIGDRGKISAKTGYEPKVALIKFYPNSEPGILDYYASKGYKGAIIEGTGLGHVAIAPQEKEYGWLDHIKKAVKKGMVIGITSQCLYGRVHPSVYRYLRLLKSAGAIHCEDMLPETALVKLGWLLGSYGKGKAAELLNKNLVGEITPRTMID